jgi:hypothetical protein
VIRAAAGRLRVWAARAPAARKGGQMFNPVSRPRAADPQGRTRLSIETSREGEAEGPRVGGQCRAAKA